MNIVFLAARLHSNYVDSLKNLSGSHEVTVLLRGSPPAISELNFQQVPPRFQTVTLRPETRQGANQRMRTMCKNLGQRIRLGLWFWGWTKRNKIDVIYSRTEPVYLFETARVIARIRRICFITYSQKIHSPKNSSINAIHSIALQAPDECASPSFIPLAIDLARVPAMAPDFSYAAHGGPLRILMVGRFGMERKGHKLLLEAVDILRDKLDVFVTLYGSGSRRSELFAEITQSVEKGLEDRIATMPPIAREKMLLEYPKHHLFVHPGWSGADASPSLTYERANGQTGTRLYSMVEAMACGLPVICGAERAFVGAVNNGINGLLFERHNADDLAEKILEISALDLEKMGAATREIVVRNHNAAEFTARFERLLEARCANFRSGRLS